MSIRAASIFKDWIPCQSVAVFIASNTDIWGPTTKKFVCFDISVDPETLSKVIHPHVAGNAFAVRPEARVIKNKSPIERFVAMSFLFAFPKIAPCEPDRDVLIIVARQTVRSCIHAEAPRSDCMATKRPDACHKKREKLL